MTTRSTRQLPDNGTSFLLFFISSSLAAALHLIAPTIKKEKNKSASALYTPSTPKLQTSTTTAIMTTMPAQHGHNEACCNIPPVISKGYDAKGSYEQVNDIKTCT